jgi:hypothetical protein
MSTAAANSKPRPAAPPAIVLRDVGARSNTGRTILRLLPAGIGSLIFHAAVLGVGFTLVAIPAEEIKTEETQQETLQAEQVSEEKRDPLLSTDIDPAGLEVDQDINFAVDRKAEVSVPGSVDPNEAVGIRDGDKAAPPTNLPAPGGFGALGQGGALETTSIGNSTAVGELGGYGPRGMPLQGTFYGRSGATREFALRNGGGTKESEAAVARGLKWLIRVQLPDGRWKLDHPAFKEKGLDNDVAGTALGLLPLLAAGKTHKPAKDNPYDKPIEKGLAFLIRRMDKKTGYMGEKGAHHGSYGHGLATIVLCEAYGLTQDSNLRRPAQMAINYIVTAQHEAGGWRYRSGEAGDLSVTGWMVMGLKSALMAGLDVPAASIRKATSYLDSVCDTRSEGYGYTGGNGTPTMTAVGLLCRQYLQSWGPQNLRMIKSVDNFIKKTPPTTRNCYYYYYATQVMHHFGGEAWTNWNNQMREHLVKTQDKDEKSAGFGSWSAAGDAWASSGGRLMVTSLNLLTLEVYYRYLPLYYREAGAKKDEVVQRAQ